MVNFWGKLKKMPRKDMSWTQAKARNPKLLPFSDADKDGVKNWLDCKPFDRKRQDYEVLGYLLEKGDEEDKEEITELIKSKLKNKKEED